MFAPAALLIAAACCTLAAEDGPPALERQEYEGFFPFFARETFEGGSVKTTAAFGIWRKMHEPDGDGYHHLLPLYYSSLSDGGNARALGLLSLYFHGRHQEGGYDVLLPSLAWWKSGPSEHVLLWPAVHAAREPQDLPFRLIPTLYRHGKFEDGSTDRLGAPFLLELFERSDRADVLSFTLGNLFNFAAETRSGLPLAKLTLEQGKVSHAHLFPLFFTRFSGEEKSVFTPLLGRLWGAQKSIWASPILLTGWLREPGRTDLHALWPLVRVKETEESSWAHAFPFFFRGERRSPDGSVSSRSLFLSALYGETEDRVSQTVHRYVPLLFGHYETSPTRVALDLPFPLGHYSREGDSFTARALPVFDAHQDSSGRSMGIGGLLYRRHEKFMEKTVGQWAPFPFVHWKTSPGGLVAWALPAFYHRNESDPERTVRTTIAAPTLFSHEEITTNVDGETKMRRYLHLWPFFGYGRKVGYDKSEERSYSTIFPFIQVKKNRPASNPERLETTVHAPWPLVRHWSDGGDFRFRLFPLFFTGREANHKWTVIPALFSWDQTGDDRTLIAACFLLYWRNTPDAGSFHLFPIGFGRRQEGRWRWGIFPLVYSRDYGEQEIGWSPARLLFAWNDLRSQGARHRSLLWKAMEWTQSGDDYDFRLFHRLLVNRDVKGQREIAVGPFFRSLDDEPAGRRKLSILSFVYRSTTEQGIETRRVFGIPLRKSWE